MTLVAISSIDRRARVGPTQSRPAYTSSPMPPTVEFSDRILVFAKGGRLADDLALSLPFPRDVADPEVALTKANVFKTFEDIGALAVS